MPFLFNLVFSATAIAICAWLARTRPDLAGFVISLPLSTLLVLALTQFEQGDSGKTVLLAKSIFVALPMTMVFFVPFFFVERFKLSFWTAYLSGLALLGVVYVVHRYVLIWMRIGQ